MTAARPTIARLKALATGREARFLVAGAWNTLFGYLAFLGVYLMAGASAGLAVVLTVSYAISLLQAFAVQRWWVFRSDGALPAELARFALANSVVFGANLLFLPLAVRASDVPPPLLQAIFVLASTIASYFLHKHFSFARKS